MGRGPLPPLVHKIMCGQRLEALRERALLSRLGVAKRFEWSQSKVANIETPVSAVSRRDLDLLLEQTEDCMRYPFRAYRPSWPADEVESGVERRLGRQAALDNTDQRVLVRHPRGGVALAGERRRRRLGAA